MAGRGREFLEHAHFAVGGLGRGQHDAYRQPPEFRRQPRDFAEGGVGRVAHAKQNLEFRVVLQRVRTDALVEVRIQAAHGLQNRNTRQAGRDAVADPQAAQRGGQRQQLVDARRGADR